MQHKYNNMINFKLIFVVSVMFFLSACGNQENSKTDKKHSRKNENVIIDTLNQADNPSDVKTGNAEIDDNSSIWVYDYMADTIIQLRTVKKEILTSEKLISIINLKYQDKVRLDFVNILHDTIFVKIDNSEYLTQQMGTAGATVYMISATFTLTELPNIKFVNFDFEVGDHALPGTYGRKGYLDWIQGNKELNKK